MSQDDSQWQITEGKENVNRMEDQYLNAWKEWVERDRLEKSIQKGWKSKRDFREDGT